MSYLFAESIRADQEAQKLVRTWLAALRSGDYKQGRAVLRNSNNEFCCLGVACDLIDHDAWSEEPIGDGGDKGYEHPLGATNEIGESVVGQNLYYLDEATQDRLHMTEGAVTELGRLNDGNLDLVAKTFTEIADIIERDFEEVLSR